MINKYSDLCAAIRYAFLDESLLRQALTHRSFLNECQQEGEENNERLEFLGDAVIDLVVGHQLMERMPLAREGQLSKMRAMVVSEGSLASCATAVGLGGYLRLGKGEEQSGGRQKNSLLADALEAIIGAVFLEGSYEAADRVLRHLLNDQMEEAVNGNWDRDHKTRLQELAQAHWHQMPVYLVIEENGPDHSKLFTVGVYLGEKEISRGVGTAKKIAEQQAARRALPALERMLSELERSKVDERADIVEEKTDIVEEKKRLEED